MTGRRAGLFPKYGGFFLLVLNHPQQKRRRPGMPNPKPFPDTRIAAEAQTRLAWDAAVPEHCVKVRVSRGRITLHGELQLPSKPPHSKT